MIVFRSNLTSIWLANEIVMMEVSIPVGEDVATLGIDKVEIVEGFEYNN